MSIYYTVMSFEGIPNSFLLVIRLIDRWAGKSIKKNKKFYFFKYEKTFVQQLN